MAEPNETEVWWIHSETYGLRIAWFLRLHQVVGDPMDGVMIMGEPPERTGIRIWADIVRREGWRKVRRIPIPGEPDDAVELIRELLDKGEFLGRDIIYHGSGDPGDTPREWKKRAEIAIGQRPYDLSAETVQTVDEALSRRYPWGYRSEDNEP
jgi:hypothetical protein